MIRCDKIQFVWIEKRLKWEYWTWIKKSRSCWNAIWTIRIDAVSQVDAYLAYRMHRPMCGSMTRHMFSCLFVCMHACMHVCMHACMYVCLDGCLYISVCVLLR